MDTLLSFISWTQYLATLLLISLTYYSYLAYQYYPQEIQNILQRKTKAEDNPFAFDSESNSIVLPSLPADQTIQDIDEQQQEEPQEDTIDRIEMMIDQLSPLIQGHDGDPKNFQFLKQSLSRVLKSYPDLKQCSLRGAIIELIQTQVSKTSSVLLTEQEIMLLWE